MCRDSLSEHFNSEMVGFTSLDSVTNNPPRIDISDLVGFECDTPPWGPHISDIPAPDLAWVGRFQHWSLTADLPALTGGDLGAEHLVLDPGGDPPPCPFRREEQALVPRVSERVID